MTLKNAIETRRSIRKFTDKKIPPEVILEALRLAILAPNSSNTQTWNFTWVETSSKKSELVKACLSQAAARTASELIVISADPKLWRRSQNELIQFVERINAPQIVQSYYKKLIPMVYRWGVFNSYAPIKWLLFNTIGLFRPIMRSPIGRRDIQEVAIKSAALAAENFVLAMTSMGFQTCMMEGFDEFRVKRILNMSCSERVVMVIACGEAAENGTWGPQFRLPFEAVVKRV